MLRNNNMITYQANFICREFCLDTLEAGTAVFFVERIGYNAVTSNSKNIYPLVGISLNNVVNIDLTKQKLPYNTVVPHSKIQIATCGTITVKLPIKWKLKPRQRIFANPKNGKLTWRYSKYEVGCVIKSQDEDGFCEIRLDLFK